MPLYMTRVSYTSEALAALTRNPENRGEAFGGLAETIGGRLVSFYYSSASTMFWLSTKPPTKAPPPSSWPLSPPVISVG